MRLSFNISDTLRDLRDQVVAPTLEHLGKVEPRLNSPAAVDLLIGTALVESWGHNLKQDGAGPALSPWQIEPATADDILDRYLARDDRQQLGYQAIDLMVDAREADEQLAGNFYFACAIARARYWMVPEPLPAAPAAGVRGQDLAPYAAALGDYWKRHYNTALGSGDAGTFAHRFLTYWAPIR